jgi:transketolase
MSGKDVRQQFADTMLEVGQEDPTLIVLVGDISHGVLQPYAKACPGRYYNVGICEPTIISMSAGLSNVGWRPVAHTIAPFLLERSFEQIKLDFCYHSLPGNLVTVGSAFDYSNLGSTHHCYDDFALIKSLQNTEIVYPGSAIEFDTLFKQAYTDDFLTLYRVPGATHDVEFSASDLELGKITKVREGTNLTILATGPQLQSAMDAVNGLVADGWDPEILYAHTVHPIDKEAVRASAAKTGRVITIEEHMEIGGVGDDVLRATRDMPNVFVQSLAIPGRFITEYGTYREHCETLGLTSEGIQKRVAEVFHSPNHVF